MPAAEREIAGRKAPRRGFRVATGLAGVFSLAILALILWLRASDAPIPILPAERFLAIYQGLPIPIEAGCGPPYTYGAGMSSSRPSPNGLFVAHTDLGWLYTHEIELYSAASGETVQLLEIEEVDPFSGHAHRFCWSLDSRFLIVAGQGILTDYPIRRDRWRHLPVVYDARDQCLYDVSNADLRAKLILRDM